MIIIYYQLIFILHNIIIIIFQYNPYNGQVGGNSYPNFAIFLDFKSAKKNSILRISKLVFIKLCTHIYIYLLTHIYPPTNIYIISIISENS